MLATRVLLCLAAVAVLVPAYSAFQMKRPGDDLDRDLSIIKKCNSSSPVSRDVMNNVLIHKILLGANHYGFKCFLHCVYMEYGWMEKHGEFRHSVIKEFLRGAGLSLRAVRKLVAKCTDSESQDRCERAYEYTQCFWGELKRSQFDSLDELELEEYDLPNRLNDGYD